MIAVAASFIAGIAAFKSVAYFPVSLSACCLLTISILFLRYPEKKRYLFFLAFIFASGFLYSWLRQHDAPQFNFPSEELHVVGDIADVPETDTEKVRFVLDRVIVEGTAISGKVRLSLYAGRSGKQVPGIDLRPGDKISAVARLREPGGFRNPGVYAFDLKAKGIVAVGYVKHMMVLNDARIEPSAILILRQRLAATFEKSLSRESASFLKVIIPGLRGGVGPELREAFGTAGLAHLLSISGTHFGLLAFIIFQTVRRTALRLPAKALSRITLYFTPTQAAVICTIPVLGAYASLSGMSTPTIRSLIMVLIYLLALLLGRRGEWMNSLSIAAVIILIWNPFALFELSCALSFTAVFSIGCILELRTRNDEDMQRLRLAPRAGIEKAYEKLKISLLLTIAAVLGTAPLSVSVFHRIPLIAPVSNLIVTPLVCFVILPIGFISGFTALIFHMQIIPVASLIDRLTGLALLLVRFFADIPCASVPVHTPPLFMLILYAASWLFLLKGSHRWRLLPLALIILLYLAFPFFQEAGLRITFLDVGQGDAATVEFPDNTVMLIDGGSEDLGAGERAIAPLLWSRGISTIDFLVVSHAHPDHIGGLTYILDNFEVRQVWSTARAAAGAADFFRTAEERGITVRTPVRGDSINGKDYRIYVLHPHDSYYAFSPRGAFSDQNNDSLVLKIETEGLSVLFTGDIEVEAERNMHCLGKWLESSILKVPHHGGRTSSSRAFLAGVKPAIAVASAGKGNPFHHPHGETLSRYKERGVRLFRTDRDGAVTVSGHEGVSHVTTYKDSRFIKVRTLQDELRNIGLLF